VRARRHFRPNEVRRKGGVAADQVVVDRRLDDALEEAVRLGDGCLGCGGAETLGMPLAHAGCRDLVQVERAEGREDVQAEEVPVQVLGTDRQLSLLDPLLGVRAEVDRAGVRCALKGLFRTDALAIRAEVGGSPATGAVLTHRAEAATPSLLVGLLGGYISPAHVLTQYPKTMPRRAARSSAGRRPGYR
jgi:hypothetical protein